VSHQLRILGDRKVRGSIPPPSANYTILGWGDSAAFGKGSRVGRSRVLSPKLGIR
jgi:hypothetical protein